MMKEEKGQLNNLIEQYTLDVKWKDILSQAEKADGLMERYKNLLNEAIGVVTYATGKRK